MSKIKELLIVSEENVKKIKMYYGKTEEDIKNDINILQDWLCKQPHLPKFHDETRLERFLLKNKFRMEQSKTKQDNYYTYRGLYPDFFLHMDPECDAIKNARKSVSIVILPKLLPSLERLYFCQFEEGQEDNFNFRDVVGHLLMTIDLLLSYDYALAETFVVDCKNLSLKYVFKIDPITLHKAIFLYQSAFSGRIGHLDFINLPPAFDVFLSLLKRVFDAKLFGKIRTHISLDALYEVVPREYLPKELGGDGGSMYKVHDEWGEELIRQKDFLKENSKRISNEKLRIGKSVHNELFGIQGTFRKINLD